jgi:hypothetical protein
MLENRQKRKKSKKKEERNKTERKTRESCKGKEDGPGWRYGRGRGREQKKSILS